MEWLILLAVIVVLILILQKGKKGTNTDYPYTKHEVLVTAAERSFYGVLRDAVKEKAVVFTKVRVGDVLKTRKGLSASRRQSAFNRIASKHFDFIICDPDTLSIIAAVELDDASHNSKKRMKRDELLNKACAAADLTLHHFKAKKSYNIAELRDVLFPDLVEPAAEQPIATPRVEANAVEAEARYCPKCESKLMARVANKGSIKATTFWHAALFLSVGISRRKLSNSSLSELAVRLTLVERVIRSLPHQLHRAFMIC